MAFPVVCAGECRQFADGKNHPVWGRYPVRGTGNNSPAFFAQAWCSTGHMLGIMGARPIVLASRRYSASAERNAEQYIRGGAATRHHLAYCWCWTCCVLGGDIQQT